MEPARIASPPASEEERAARLAAASFNVLNIDDADVEFDLFSDNPPRAFLPAVQQAGVAASVGGGSDPPLQALCERVYGPARYVVTGRGRAAEMALAAQLIKPGMTVVTHGLFKTTQYSIQRHGGKLEFLPRRMDASGAREDGTADFDLPTLERRFASGRVDAVYVEPCNRALASWPLQLDNVEAIRRLCKQNDALLLLDATRLLSNVVYLGGAPFELAQAFTRLSDAFVLSCAKELLAPLGALVGVRDHALERRVYAYAYQEGTLLEPHEARARLARGIEETLASPRAVVDRLRQVRLLAQALRDQGIPILEPVGASAVCVLVGKELLGDDPLRPRALEGLLYRLGGIRALIYPSTLLERTIMMLAPGVARYSDDGLRGVARSVRALFDRAASAPRLSERPSETVHDMFNRYQPA
jgi:tryptophanase